MSNVSITTQGIMWLMGALVLIGGVITTIRTIIKPIVDMKECIKTNESHIKEIKQEQELNDQSHEQISKDLKMIMKSQLCLLQHGATGNATGELDKMHKEMQEYIIDN